MSMHGNETLMNTVNNGNNQEEEHDKWITIYLIELCDGEAQNVHYD